MNNGLRNSLQQTSDKFEKINHAFLINITKDNNVVMQIIHGVLIQEPKIQKKDFNFTLNLTFDNEINNLQKFRKLDFINEFAYYEFDQIPCYAINFGNNQHKTYKMVIEILKKVYGFKESDTFEFEIYDQGPV